MRVARRAAAFSLAALLLTGMTAEAQPRPGFSGGGGFTGSPTGGPTGMPRPGMMMGGGGGLTGMPGPGGIQRSYHCPRCNKVLGTGNFPPASANCCGTTFTNGVGFGTGDSNPATGRMFGAMAGGNPNPGGIGTPGFMMGGPNPGMGGPPTALMTGSGPAMGAGGMFGAMAGGIPVPGGNPGPNPGGVGTAGPGVMMGSGPGMGAMAGGPPVGFMMGSGPGMGMMGGGRPDPRGGGGAGIGFNGGGIVDPGMGMMMGGGGGGRDEREDQPANPVPNFGGGGINPDTVAAGRAAAGTGGTVMIVVGVCMLLVGLAMTGGVVVLGLQSQNTPRSGSGVGGKMKKKKR